jgi:TonB family protein
VRALRIFALLLTCFVVSFALEVRAQNAWTGTGVVLVDVDYESGKVTAARMLQTTGSHHWDEAALAKFRKWTFKPKTVRHVKIPVTFTLKH